MNNTEAKFILNAYRPNGRDASDATFCAALEQAKTDPGLGAWFAREQAHGTAVAAKLREIAPPAGLREAILAGGRVSGGNLAAPPARRMRWSPPVWLAAAAAAVLLVVAFWPKSAPGGAVLTDFAFDDTLEPTRHGGRGEAAAALQAKLGDTATRLAGGLPVDFATLRTTGCRTLNVAGRDVLEVCFKRDGSWFHCYIARVEDFSGQPAKEEPVFAQKGKVAVASWADGTHRFIVASLAGREAVERLL